MSWLVSTRQYIPAVIGEAWGGGYFAGYISHTANGNPTHALIVAPRATGYVTTNTLAWALNQNAGNGTNYSTTTIGATTPAAAKDYDGPSNMALMTAIGISNFPAAEFCKNLTIGGFTDWYLPSRYEQDIAYFNLKPGTISNGGTMGGVNIYAVPQRNSGWSLTNPARTTVTAFNTSTEAYLEVDHWSSTEGSVTQGWNQSFYDGASILAGKTGLRRVRAFRKIAL